MGSCLSEKENSYVLDGDGNRHDIDIQQIDRVVQPGTALVEREHPVALTYPDGAVLRGKIAQVNPDGVLLQTAFANAPIECMFAGASLLRMESRGPKNNGQIEDEDRLFHPLGNLRGRVSFDIEDGSFVRWKPVGASKAVGLANSRRAHIERNNRRASKVYPFDPSQFRHILHLKSGEIIPCQILTYDEKTVGFQSPFISAHLMDAADVKALEFSGRTQARYSDWAHSTNNKRLYTVLDKGGNRFNNRVIHRIEVKGDGNLDRFLAEGGEIDVREGEIILTIEGKKIHVRPAQNLDEAVVEEVFHGGTSKNHRLDEKLERALTVPRFNRDTPPSHILVAENGDMKRGKLLFLNGETIRFDSKLRQFSVPIDRVARVVDVTQTSIGNLRDTVNNKQRAASSEQQRGRQLRDGVVKPEPSLSLTDNSHNEANVTTDNSSEVAMRLTDGSILMFEPLEIKDDTLLGRSSIYGEIRVPIESIQHLYLGDTSASFEAAFAAWVVRPAKEPVFSDEP